jgi:hypothetical protein
MDHRDILEAIESVKDVTDTAIVVVHFRNGNEYRIEVKTGETTRGHDAERWSKYILDMRQNMRWGSVSLVIVDGEEIHATRTVGTVGT